MKYLLLLAMALTACTVRPHPYGSCQPTDNLHKHITDSTGQRKAAMEGR